LTEAEIAKERIRDGGGPAPFLTDVPRNHEWG
jgi:hypothetical protein